MSCKPDLIPINSNELGYFFFFLRRSYFLLHFDKTAFSDTESWLTIFFSFSTFHRSAYITYWLQVSNEKSADNSLKISCEWWIFSLLLPSRCSLALDFWSLTIIYLDAGLCAFLLVGIDWGSWICTYMSFISLGSSSTSSSIYYFLNNLSSTNSLLFLEKSFVFPLNGACKSKFFVCLFF